MQTLVKIIAKTDNELKRILTLLLSYKSYYNALRLWVKKNEKNLSSRLLLDLDEDKYLVDNPEFSLEMEEKRKSRINYSKIDAVLMEICAI